jgi:hypothetical protein
MIKVITPQFRRTETVLQRLQQMRFLSSIHLIGQLGVNKLSANTPVDTGNTAASWDYTVTHSDGGVMLTWTNSVMAGRVPLVILIRYGHATGTGGYVSARNFITPALRGIEKSLLDEIVKEIRL